MKAATTFTDSVQLFPGRRTNFMDRTLKINDLWGVTRFPDHAVTPECHRPYNKGTVEQKWHFLVQEAQKFSL